MTSICASLRASSPTCRTAASTSFRSAGSSPLGDLVAAFHSFLPFFLTVRTIEIVRRLFFMTLLPRKGLLAIAVVVDLALQTEGQLISAKTLAIRHGLPPRHLESLLQSLMHNGVLKGVRGPHGGYELVRDQKGVTVNDILHAAGTIDEEEEELKSEIVTKVVLPVLSPAEQAFGQALNEIKLDDMVRYSPVKRLRT